MGTWEARKQQYSVCREEWSIILGPDLPWSSAGFQLPVYFDPSDLPISSASWLRDWAGPASPRTFAPCAVNTLKLKPHAPQVPHETLPVSAAKSPCPTASWQAHEFRLYSASLHSLRPLRIFRSFPSATCRLQEMGRATSGPFMSQPWMPPSLLPSQCPCNVGHL